MDAVINHHKGIINLLERIKLYCILDEQDTKSFFDHSEIKEYKCSSTASSTGFTILHKLVIMTHKYPNLNNFLVEYLKDYPNINETNNKGWTALHLAAKNSKLYSSEETVKILINAGINLNLQSICGWSAFHLATRYLEYDSTEQTVKILVDAGANLDLQTKNGFTGLHFVCAKLKKKNADDKILEILKLLTAYGSNLAIKNKKGLMALDYISEEIKSVLMCKNVGECVICYGDLEGLDCSFQHHICINCLLKTKAKTCVICTNKLITI